MAEGSTRGGGLKLAAPHRNPYLGTSPGASVCRVCRPCWICKSACMARGLVRTERDSGFCIWWERAQEGHGSGRTEEATPAPGPSSAPPSHLLSAPTHLLEEDRELKAELLLELGVPREQRHIHHHLPGRRQQGRPGPAHPKNPHSLPRHPHHSGKCGSWGTPEADVGQ